MVGLLRKPWVPVVLVLVAVVAAVALYLFQPWRAFTDRTVDESAPAAGTGQSQGQGEGQGQGQDAGGRQAARTLSTGSFIGHEHGTSGKASVIKLADGKHVLRIENLDTSDGPDLRVWMSDQPVKKGNAGWFVFDDGKYAELGKLKGNKGNQNYAIPAGTDLNSLKSVTIWCKRFHVSFGAAALT